MPFEKDPKEIGALWSRVSRNGNQFMSGKVNGVDVVCFKNTKATGKQPDWRVMKSEPREESPVDQRPVHNANSTPLDDF